MNTWHLTRDVHYFKGRRYVTARQLHSTGAEAVAAWQRYTAARQAKIIADFNERIRAICPPDLLPFFTPD